MRKVVFIFAALALLAGCTIDSPVIRDSELRMLFQPEMYSHVTDRSNNPFPTDQDFAVCAWNSERLVFGLTKAFSQEVMLTDSIRKVQVKDTLWAFADERIWPDKNQTISFSAFSPTDARCVVTKDKGVQWSTDILEEQVDLLYSHKEMSRKENIDENVVHMCFSHALSQVSFRVKNRVDNTGALEPFNRPDKITIKRITIDGVKHSGSFCSLPSPTWTLDDDVQPLKIFEGTYQTAGTPEPIGTVWLMVPQKFNTTITVQFQYTTFANTTITQVLKTVPMKTTLEPGRAYTYTLSVGIDDVKFLQELIEEELN